jgi:dienelactone hydrolase
VTALLRVEPERVRITSRTPASFAPLLAETDALAPIDIDGYLSFPSGDGAALPLVILCIGSIGMRSGRETMYTRALTAAGFAVLLVDGNSARGVDQTVSDQSRLPFAACVADALFAARHICSHPRIDPRRMALMGYSRGGFVSITAYHEPLQAAILGEDLRLTAHVALYPPVYLRWARPRPTRAPLLVILGGCDDIAPESQVRICASELKAAGGNLDVLAFPEAHHSFDADIPVAYEPEQRNMSTRTMRIDEHGEITDTGSGLRVGNDWPGFLRALAASPDSVRGATSGSGPLARDVAVAPVLAFLQSSLARR